MFSLTPQCDDTHPDSPADVAPGPNGDQGGATRPNRVCRGSLANPTPAEWFNLGCFPVPADTYAYGNSGRNILNGPGDLALNLSLAKQFKIREYGTLEFRWENFNVTNHTNFQLPNDAVDTPSAGTITADNGNRVIQFGGMFRF